MSLETQYPKPDSIREDRYPNAAPYAWVSGFEAAVADLLFRDITPVEQAVFARDNVSGTELLVLDDSDLENFVFVRRQDCQIPKGLPFHDSLAMRVSGVIDAEQIYFNHDLSGGSDV